MSSKLIPQPVRMEERPGHFRLPEASRVGIPVHLPESRFLQQLLQNTLGVDLPVVCTDDDEVIPGEIRFEILKQSLAEEAYELEVNPVRLCIRSGGGAGLFYGLQTLRQLLPDGAPVEEIPCLFIQDEPRFGWRGMHLDCARHFLPKGFVLKFLDLMALYKFNRFHWHLTDDQGWRLEIQSFPRLTEVSAWREETLVGHVDALPHSCDGISQGGKYTREDVSEIVAYAAARHIMVIPEIEMPGHSQAVLAAYPELGCTPGPYETRKIWGISEEVYCAGKEKTFHFLERVLTEVMELFPGPYLHIGGDECPKTRWEQCPACQERIRSESLRDCHELQSYFIKRIDAFLHAHG
ncbi:MAG: beta-N-acetylhexosaminidase, partial [Kiritimatiellia bacterium]